MAAAQVRVLQLEAQHNLETKLYRLEKGKLVLMDTIIKRISILDCVACHKHRAFTDRNLIARGMILVFTNCNT